MEYTLELSSVAKRDLKRLPNGIQREILFTHLPAIQSDPNGLGFPLRGTLEGERSYHFGRKPEYRIIYLVEEELITVTIIGSRENIYKRAKRHHRK